MSAKPRKFMYNGAQLPDFDPTKTPDEIKQHYAAQYPELTTATAVFSKEKDGNLYEFKKSAGTKG